MFGNLRERRISINRPAFKMADKFGILRNNVFRGAGESVRKNRAGTMAAVMLASSPFAGYSPLSLVSVGAAGILAGCKPSPVESNSNTEKRPTLSSADVERARNIFVDPNAESLVIKPNTTKEDINNLNVSAETKAVLLRVIDLSTYFNRPLSQFPITIGKPSVEIPSPFAGYQTGGNDVKTFMGNPALFALTKENLQPEDRTTAQFAQILNTNVAATPSIAVDSTASLIILNFAPEYKLRPGGATPTFPMIFTKFSSENASPSPYLTGTSANHFFFTGLTMQIPNYLDSNCQVHVGSNMDPISGAAPQPGKVEIHDPRISTLRWFAWNSSSVQSGIPRNTWKIDQDTDGNGVGDLLTGFNTFPLVSETASQSQLESYFSGNIAVNESLGTIPDDITASPDILVYNKVGREDSSKTFGIIPGKKTGLVYVFPNGDAGYRTEEIHFGLTINWPKRNVPYNSTANTIMTIYQYWPAARTVQSVNFNLGTDKLSQ